MSSEARRLAGLAGAGVALYAAAPAVLAADYLTLAQAQRAVFPEATGFTPVALAPTPAQREAVAKLAGPQPPRGRLQAWRVMGAGGPIGWFFTDEVAGRQDFIDYALGIDADGTLRTPEVMSYRESHGAEVRNDAWRRQFARRRDGATLRPAIDIRNIAGATLSCEHLTAGVRFLAALWQVALRAPPGTAP